jgi:hypothetical protein
MARLGKVAAAKALGISRTTLYKLISIGQLSAYPDGTIDPAELSRVVDTLHTAARPVHTTDAHLRTHDVDNVPQGRAHHERPSWTGRAHPDKVSSEQPWTGELDTLCDMVALLREGLARAHRREQAALAREAAAQEHITRLTAMLPSSSGSRTRPPGLSSFGATSAFACAPAR